MHALDCPCPSCVRLFRILWTISLGLLLAGLAHVLITLRVVLTHPF